MKPLDGDKLFFIFFFFCLSRDLAREMGHPWAEYWDFLDSFLDLSSNEGLRKLEEYLSRKDFSPKTHEETAENETSNRFKRPSPGACYSDQV